MANLTAPAIATAAHCAEIHGTYVTIAAIAGSVLSILALLLYSTTISELNPETWSPHMPSIMMSSIGLLPWLAEAIYYSGYQINAIEPPICPTDKPDDLPCQLKHVVDWGRRYLQGLRREDLGVLRPGEKILVRGSLMYFVFLLRCFMLIRWCERTNREVEELELEEKVQQRLRERKMIVSPLNSN